MLLHTKFVACAQFYATVLLQNIDSLEKQASLSEEKLIQAHGSFTTASCTADDCTYTCRGVEVRLIECFLQ